MSKFEFDIVKLKGSDNYHQWKFSITSYLEFKDFDKTIVSATAEVSPEKNVDASTLETQCSTSHNPSQTKCEFGIRNMVYVEKAV